MYEQEQPDDGGTPQTRPMEERIEHLLEQSALNRDGTIFEGVRQLAEQHGDSVYASLLHTLTHLDFEIDAAKNHWEEIHRHVSKINRLFGRNVDFRIALMDYFVEINRQIENPIVIEIRLFKKTQKSALVDELTGLANYRSFKLHLGNELKRTKRYRSPFSFIMLDIDDFKQYNDRFGHAAGNQALRDVAEILRKSTRESDIVFRYGGEEYAVILPETDAEGAMTVGERIRSAVEGHVFIRQQEGQGARLTISGGIATFRGEEASEEELVSAADRTLYMAKGRGKNRIETMDRDERTYLRAEARFDGSYWVMSLKECPFVCRNVSEGGILFHAEKAPTAGEALRLRFEMSGGEGPIECVARVVRVQESEAGSGYEIGACFVDLGQRERYLLNSYVRQRATPTDRS